MRLLDDAVAAGHVHWWWCGSVMAFRNDDFLEAVVLPLDFRRLD